MTLCPIRPTAGSEDATQPGMLTRGPAAQLWLLSADSPRGMTMEARRKDSGVGLVPRKREQNSAKTLHWRESPYIEPGGVLPAGRARVQTRGRVDPGSGTRARSA